MYSFAIIVSILVLSIDAKNYYYSYSYNSNDYNNKDTNCVIKSHGIKSDQQLQETIDKARDGDYILLDPIQYNGTFHINNKNSRRIILSGDNQCHRNTIIKGQLIIRSNKWRINSIVFENNEKAIDVENSDSIKLSNLVINDITGNAIEVNDCNDVVVDNLVIERIGGNAISFASSSQLSVLNLVASNIDGIGVDFKKCSQIELKNSVIRNVGHEVIRATGFSNNGRILGTVINGNSPLGEGWMSLEGNNWQIHNTVASGSPKDGIVVKGCNYRFNGNIFTLGGNAFAIRLMNTQNGCRHDIGWTNMIMGGRGLYNRY